MPEMKNHRLRRAFAKHIVIDASKESPYICDFSRGGLNVRLKRSHPNRRD